MPSITRRRLFGLAPAVAAMALATNAHADTRPDETLTLSRAGNAIVVEDAAGKIVYVMSGSVVRAEVSPSQLAPLERLIAASKAETAAPLEGRV